MGATQNCFGTNEGAYHTVGEGYKKLFKVYSSDTGSELRMIRTSSRA